MKYVRYNTLKEANFSSQEHRAVIDRYVSEYESDSAVVPELCHSDRRRIDLSEFNYEDLEKMHFHYSHKNNGKSIEKEGLISQIGKNSEELDSEEAIYFSLGIESVLHNWDIWLKWRLNRFCNPRAAGVKCSTELNTTHGAELWKLSIKWMQYMASKEYRSDDFILEDAFEFERIELSRSDYYALTITPGIDYPSLQFDPKKAFIGGSDYAEEIYGVGVSTHLDNEYAEKWNLSTKLGEKAKIPADCVWRLAAEGKDNALSVLSYLYQRYMEYCGLLGDTPAAFALLPKFLEYCEKH